MVNRYGIFCCYKGCSAWFLNADLFSLSPDKKDMKGDEEDKEEGT